jgi:uncharacterized protein YjbI with pentapeptide repeats
LNCRVYIPEAIYEYVGLQKSNIMVRTRGYDTKEEAAEAWNTWAGGKRAVSQDAFNQLNEDVKRDYPIKQGKLVLPDGEHAFGDLAVDPDGGYKHPWPKIYLSDYANSEAGLYGEDDMFMVYKLRARWRLIERDHKKLRKKVAETLESNDKDNLALNAQLKAWNTILSGSGFPLFEENDLRGMDLSGLTITPQAEGRVWLRGVNLSYSESHLLHLVNANLYGAKCSGIKAVQVDFSYATAHGVCFGGSYMPDGRFIGADLGFCDFRHALLSHCVFDGANCHAADFSSALLWKASFDNYTDSQSDKRIFSDLSKVVWNDETRFAEVVFNDFLTEQNKALADHIHDQRTLKTAKQELASSIEMKPGAFGFSVDLSRVLGALKAAWRKRKKNTQ